MRRWLPAAALASWLALSCDDPSARPQLDPVSPDGSPTASTAAAASTASTAATAISSHAAPTAKPAHRLAIDARPHPPLCPDTPAQRSASGHRFPSWVERHYPRLSRLYEVLREIHQGHPDRTELVVLGYSHEDRPVVGLAVGRRLGTVEARRRPAFLLNGAHHGDEPLAALVVLDAIDYLLEREGEDERVTRWLDELVVWAVPIVNPDGFATFCVNHGAGRKNRRGYAEKRWRKWETGVDLNRNYPFRWNALKGAAGSPFPFDRWYRGPAPGSEPEVQTMMRLGLSEHFVGSVSFHAGAVALLASYSIPGARLPVPDEAWVVAEQIAAKLPAHPEWPMKLSRSLYSVDGTDPDWHRYENGTVALLVEVARRSHAKGKLRDASVAVSRAIWQELLERYLDGPTVAGHVVDAAGRPVVADVRLAEIVTHEGESWTSRCRDGRFDRFLPKTGPYTLRVQVPGYDAVERSFHASPGRTRLDVTLPMHIDDPADCPTPAPPTKDAPLAAQ